MSRRYTGLLAQPIVLTPQTSDEELDAAICERTRSLYVFFQIDRQDKNAKRLLLRALIERHVPGFRFKATKPLAGKKRRGRPPALSPVQRVMLQNRMDSLISKSIRKPAYQLSSDPDLREVDPETLRRTYYKDRKKYEHHKDPIVGIANEFISEVSARLKLQLPSKSGNDRLGRNRVRKSSDNN